MARGRTRLTVPPGEEPAPPPGAAARTEAYSAAFAVPSEPRYWTRIERFLTVMGVILMLFGLGYGVFSYASRGQNQDPALNQQPLSEAPSE